MTHRRAGAHRGPRHRSKDPVEKLHVSLPISLKAWFLAYVESHGYQQSAVIRELLTGLREGRFNLERS